MCAQIQPRLILSSKRVFGGMEPEPMLTPREKSPLQEAQRRLEEIVQNLKLRLSMQLLLYYHCIENSPSVHATAKKYIPQSFTHLSMLNAAYFVMCITDSH